MLFSSEELVKSHSSWEKNNPMGTLRKSIYTWLQFQIWRKSLDVPNFNNVLFDPHDVIISQCNLTFPYLLTLNILSSEICWTKMEVNKWIHEWLLGWGTQLLQIKIMQDGWVLYPWTHSSPGRQHGHFVPSRALCHNKVLKGFNQRWRWVWEVSPNWLAAFVISFLH